MGPKKTTTQRSARGRGRGKKNSSIPSSADPPAHDCLVVPQAGRSQSPRSLSPASGDGSVPPLLFQLLHHLPPHSPASLMTRPRKRRRLGPCWSYRPNCRCLPIHGLTQTPLPLPPIVDVSSSYWHGSGEVPTRCHTDVGERLVGILVEASHDPPSLTTSRDVMVRATHRPLIYWGHKMMAKRQ